MRQSLLTYSYILLLSLTTSLTTYASDDDDDDNDRSRRSEAFQASDTVADTVTALSEFLSREGFDIILTVDHAASAARVGLELAPTQVIFARQPRKIERRLLRRSDTIGIDLPLKFLVFENEGEIQVDINAIGYLIDRHDLPLRDRLLRFVDRKIKSVADAPEGLVTIASEQTLAVSVETLISTISAIPAFRIPLVLDYSARNGEDDENAGPVLVVIANANVGTGLMQANQRMGIDLPQKFLFWQDDQGNVNITYNDPLFLAERHDVQGVDARLQAISNALANFASIAAGTN